MNEIENRYGFGNWDRYHWLNLDSIDKHGTIEIRLHSSTLDANKVCNWVKAHLRFVDWVVDGGMSTACGRPLKSNSR